MAIEPKRGCGYRVVGGLYLMGGTAYVECDRLPIEIEHCPVCGSGLRFTRAITEINAFKLWGHHQGCEEEFACSVCRPPMGISFLMMVGEKFYTVVSFLDEAKLRGVSKRIPAIPRHLTLGKSVVYLAHNRGMQDNSDEKRLAVFASFVPTRVEKLIWKSQATKETLDALEKQGITPIIVPDGDKDHTP